MKGTLHIKNNKWVVKWDDIVPSSNYPVLHWEVEIYPILIPQENFEEGKEVNFETVKENGKTFAKLT